MISRHSPKIRALLRANPDGLSVMQITRTLNLPRESARKAMLAMPDAYIDRWETTGRVGPPRSIWCVVNVPPHCPKPDIKSRRTKRTEKPHEPDSE